MTCPQQFRPDKLLAGEATDEIVCAIVDFGSENSIGFDTDRHPVL